MNSYLFVRLEFLEEMYEENKDYLYYGTEQ